MGLGRTEGIDEKGFGGTFEVMETSYILLGTAVAGVYTFAKTPPTFSFQRVVLLCVKYTSVSLP